METFCLIVVTTVWTGKWLAYFESKSIDFIAWGNQDIICNHPVIRNDDEVEETLSSQPNLLITVSSCSSFTDTVGEMREKVDACRSLAANYATVVRRNALAQQFDEMARLELATCERLVHEQHLQQQGWAAVVANLEDLTVDFKERCAFFEAVFLEMFKKREPYLQCLAE